VCVCVFAVTSYVWKTITGFYELK